ncbi:FtsH protease activity modulator HflK [Orbaceae bacterium ac157xtp]
MAWNQPSNNGQDNDPWGNNKPRKTTKTSGSFFDKINDVIKKGKPSGNGRSNQPKRPLNLSIVIGCIFLVIVVIWAVSGFYTINHNQRGVITRFGQVRQEVVHPGLNWLPPLIDKIYIVDVQRVRNFDVQEFMITADENLVHVEMNVQYQVSNPAKFLFNVANVDDSLRQAANSALRAQINSTNMDSILADGSTVFEANIKDELTKIVAQYNMGVNIVDLRFKSILPPDEVKDAFADANKAREDSEREIKQAEVDKVALVQKAEGQSAKILADANSYRVQVESEAEGEIARFETLLPVYKSAPELTREHLYIETMERILSNTNKVIVNDKGGNVLVLPLQQMLKKQELAQPLKDLNLSNKHLLESSNKSELEQTNNKNDDSNDSQVTSNNNKNSNEIDSPRTIRTGR